MKNLFKNLFAPKEETITIFAPFSGTVVPLGEVGDPVFADEILGPGIAINPDTGELYAPVDGEISTLFETGHAVGITTAEGLDLLIHIGIDTVELKGEGFTVETALNQKVAKGEPLLKADLATIEKLERDTITPIIITNIDDFNGLEILASGEVKVGDPLLQVKK